MPRAEQMIAAVHAYVDAFARGDAAAATALFAEDATVEDPIGTPIKQGRAAVHEFYAAAMAMGAKLELTGDPRCAGDCVAFPFAVRMGEQGGGVTIEVIDTFRFGADGKIVEMRAFWGPDNMKSA